MKTVVGVIVGIIALLLILGPGLWALGVWTAPWYGSGEARREIQGSADFRIAAYDEFFNRCSSIQADISRIENLQEELEITTDEARRNQVVATITAVRNSRDEKIASYNARAASDYTVGQFRDNDLPYQITNTENVECS